jgi:phasin family protein
MTEQKTVNQAPKAADAQPAAAVVKAATETASAATKAAAEVPAAAAKATARSAKAAAKPARARKPRAAKRAATARKAVARKAQVSVRKAATVTRNNINEGTKTMKKEANQMADRVQAVFGEANERAKTAIERNTRVAEEMTDLGKGNVEALVASTKIAAKGVEKIGQEVAEFSRKSFEDASAAIRSFADIKSPADLFRLQGEFARTQFDSMISESSKMSEAVIKLAGDVMEPLSSRASLAAERVKTAVAL